MFCRYWHYIGIHVVETIVCFCYTRWSERKSPTLCRSLSASRQLNDTQPVYSVYHGAADATAP